MPRIYDRLLALTEEAITTPRDHPGDAGGEPAQRHGVTRGERQRQEKAFYDLVKAGDPGIRRRRVAGAEPDAAKGPRANVGRRWRVQAERDAEMLREKAGDGPAGGLRRRLAPRPSRAGAPT